MSKELKTLAIMVPFYVLLLVTFIVEIQDHFVLSDFGLVLSVMFFVSIVPAVGGVIYKWMIAEKVEDEAERARLEASRTKKIIIIAVVVVIAIAIRGVTRYLI